jgi:hypothetical protein
MINPGEVNQKQGTCPMPAQQCNVGNPSFAKGIAGDYWSFLVALRFW